MKSNIHLLRVAYENWIDAGRFNSLLELLKEYPSGIGSVALFTSATHSPLTLSEIEHRVNIIKERLINLKELGFSAGINILATIGHHEEDLHNSLKDDYTHMTDEDGNICLGSYCMGDKKFQSEYVVPVYKMLSNANPDFIWIDDDIRYTHMPIGPACFCDGCIERFNKDNETDFTRDSLKDALNSGNTEIRKKWLSKNSALISDLFRLIAKVVRGIDPSITLGFMTGERYYEGYDFKAFSDALSEGGKYEIMWRPGGGAYTDYSFDDIVEKSEEIGRQTSLLPDYVTIIQSEIENFPYQLIKKTPTSTALEAMWTMTSGCTGAAFNILPSETGEPIENILPHLLEIKNRAPLFNLLKEKTAGRQPSGITTAWRYDSQAAVPEGAYNKSYGGMFASFAKELFDFGLPQCYTQKNASVTLIKGNSLSPWSDDEIKLLLKGGVYADSFALELLNERGFKRFTGFLQGEEIDKDAIECYLEHPLNEGFCDGKRNCRQAFHKGDSFSVITDSKKSEVLAKIIDYHENTLSECSLGLFQNELGGRFSVGGYYPFEWVSDNFKMTELKRLMVYLSKGELPSYVVTPCRIRNHTFKGENEMTVALLNHTNEPLKNIEVAVKTDKDVAIWYGKNAESYTINSKENKDGYSFFEIENIPGFTMGVLTV